MGNYNKLNNIIGWFSFLIATIVYFLTIEPTTSWWDCGEFIATAYKLEVGHPPGAPFFLIIARIFSLFAGDVTQVAKMINVLSALSSSFTILFLFWTITYFAKKLFIQDGELTKGKMIAVFGSGLVGSLAFTFSDSFWFSAAEGEVYAMSSFFTAIVFWAILKWESIAHEKHADRWIILIAFLMGLSIGVHLLNLLAIPAITFVIYFKKFKITRRGIIITAILSFLILSIVQYGIIPGIVFIASKFELLFVNSFGAPFGTGVIFATILYLGLTIWGLNYSKKKRKITLNTGILALTFILIGYSSYALIVIRAQASTPLNENDPSNVFSLQSYLNREQYGNRPLLYGQYYNTKTDKVKEGATIYIKGKKKYEDVGIKTSYTYDPSGCTIFPRMYSADKTRNHASAYKIWCNLRDKEKPSFGDNLSFFFRYQIGHMYLRYFMWNFAGRQNDIQGHGIDLNGVRENTKGNWICGIPFIDNRLGPQDKLPESLATNRAHNKFYLLPLLLGIIGLVFHFRKAKKDAFIVLLVFILTGLAIVVYLNQTPYQPRERDYAYAGSYYAFAIWIGLGVLGLYNMLSKKLPAILSAGTVTAISLVLVPGIMGSEGWDDHTRANKYSAHDTALNYLESCPPNAILITNGDNDTFPLWYLQEVEGVRTDIRVVNYILSSGTWYVHQLAKKLYDSDALPLTLTPEQYNQGTREYTPVIGEMNEKGIYVDLKVAIDFIANDRNSRNFGRKELLSYLPTKKLKLSVDSELVINNGTVPPELAGQVVPFIKWDMKKNQLYKNDLMLLDFLATNNWDRPVCFVNPSSVLKVVRLDEYCHLEGFVYRLMPVKAPHYVRRLGGVNTEKTYELYMEKCKWGNLDKPGVYVDPESSRNILVSRSNFARLANALVAEGKKEKAIKALDKCIEIFPDNKSIFDFNSFAIAEAYIAAGARDKAESLIKRISEVEEDNLDFYIYYSGERTEQPTFDKLRSLAIMNLIVQKNLTLADFHFKGGNSDKVKEIIARCIDIEKKGLEYAFMLYDNANQQVMGQKRQSLRMIQNIVIITEQYELSDLSARARELFDTFGSLINQQQR